MKIITRKEMESAIFIPEIIEAIEQGFAVYSEKKAVIPPVASLHFEDPPGECHIKYGYRKDGECYVVKIASVFSENSKRGIPTCNGLMLLFDKQTGEPLCVLLDEGYLTELRTAIAGVIAAKYLAPKIINSIGIVGTGGQAFYQLKLLSTVTPCREVVIWGRDPSKAKKLKAHPDLQAFTIRVTEDLGALTASCNLIVTTTSSRHPLLMAAQIQPGTHITAVGADDRGKQELDAEIFAKADRVVVDSRTQCVERGDVSYAVQEGVLNLPRLKAKDSCFITPS